MKRSLIVILFSCAIRFFFGQEPSYINFIEEKLPRASSVNIELNNRSIGEISANEVIRYKIYSTGSIKVTVAGYSGKANYLEIESGKEYYYKVHLYAGKCGEIEDSEIAKESMTEFQILNIEENQLNPVGILSSSSDGYRPAQGTGFLIADGLILTNFHVIDGAEKIILSGIQGDFDTEVKVNVHAVDVLSDLALLKIDSKLIDIGSPPYSVSDSKETKVGSAAYALGFPISDLMGNEVKVTDGIVNSNSGFKGSLSLYQFSAAVQPGNSGGPLFNSSGDVIGIVTAKLKSENVESIGYAVKADNLMLFLEQAGVEFENGTSEVKPSDLTELVERNSPFVYLIKTE